MKLVMLALAMAGMIGMIGILAIYCLCVKMRPNQTPKSKLKTSNKGSNKPGSIRKLLDKKNSNRLVLYSDTSSSSSDDSDNDSVWIPKRRKPLRTLEYTDDSSNDSTSSDDSSNEDLSKICASCKEIGKVTHVFASMKRYYNYCIGLQYGPHFCATCYTRFTRNAVPKIRPHGFFNKYQRKEEEKQNTPEEPESDSSEFLSEFFTSDSSEFEVSELENSVQVEVIQWMQPPESEFEN